MVYIRKFFLFLFSPITKFLERRNHKKKIKELQKRDPFIYK